MFKILGLKTHNDKKESEKKLFPEQQKGVELNAFFRRDFVLILILFILLQHF